MLWPDTIKAVRSAPEEIRHAWEARHTGAQSLLDLAKRARRIGWLDSLVALAILAFVVAGMAVALIYETGEGSVFVLVVIAGVGAYYAFGKISQKRRRIEKIVEQFETDLRHSELGLMHWIQEGYDVDQMQKLVDHRLTWIAQSLLIGQDEAKRQRHDDKVPEDELLTTLIARRNLAAMFPRMHAQAEAFDFDLREKREYFRLAEEKLRRGELLKDNLTKAA